MREKIILSVSLLYDDGHESPPNMPTGISFYDGTFNIEVPKFDVPKGSTVIGGVMRSGSWEIRAKCRPERFDHVGGTYTFTSFEIDVIGDRGRIR